MVLCRTGRTGQAGKRGQDRPARPFSHQARPVTTPTPTHAVPPAHLEVFRGGLDGLLEEEVHAARGQAGGGQGRHKALLLARGGHAAAGLLKG